MKGDYNVILKYLSKTFKNFRPASGSDISVDSVLDYFIQ